MDFSDKKVLVVDDQYMMVRLLSAFLAGVKVKHIFVANNVQEAVTVLQEEFIDVVLTDMSMPGENGISLVNKIRDFSINSKNMNPAIIMITGHASEDHVKEARDAGIDEFLVKPVSANSMVEKIRLVFEKRRRPVRSDDFYGPDRRRQDKDILYEMRGNG